MARGRFVGLFLRGVARQATPRRNALFAGLVMRRRTLGEWRAEATKPCRLWDGGSVSSWMKSLAAWLAPKVPNFPAWYGYSRNDSVWVITIQPIRTRMGPLSRIAPANTLQGRQRPWGARHYGEVRAESAADAYLALTRK